MNHYRKVSVIVTRVATGESMARVHLRASEFPVKPYGASVPRVACGVKIDRSYVPASDDAILTCQQCHASAKVTS